MKRQFSPRCICAQRPDSSSLRFTHIRENAWSIAEAAIFALTTSVDLYKAASMDVSLNLDAAFSAMADSTRRAILARLANGEATVTELAEPFEMTQLAISQHLKVLEDAGLIARRIDGTKRPRRLARAGI
jgi:DNA-binding MarR family transcriptional regulator